MSLVLNPITKLPLSREEKTKLEKSGINPNTASANELQKALSGSPANEAQSPTTTRSAKDLLGTSVLDLPSLGSTWNNNSIDNKSTTAPISFESTSPSQGPTVDKEPTPPTENWLDKLSSLFSKKDNADVTSAAPTTAPASAAATKTVPESSEVKKSTATDNVLSEADYKKQMNDLAVANKKIEDDLAKMQAQLGQLDKDIAASGVNTPSEADVKTAVTKGTGDAALDAKLQALNKQYIAQGEESKNIDAGTKAMLKNKVHQEAIDIKKFINDPKNANNTDIMSDLEAIKADYEGKGADASEITAIIEEQKKKATAVPKTEPAANTQPPVVEPK